MPMPPGKIFPSGNLLLTSSIVYTSTVVIIDSLISLNHLLRQKLNKASFHQKCVAVKIKKMVQYALGFQAVNF
jgi:hypothetical protein